MASSTEKEYRVHGHDSQKLLEDYFSNGRAFSDDALKFPMENLTIFFSKGNIKGDLLIDLSVGPFVHILYAACEFFKEIMVLKVQDRCLLEMKKWHNSRTGAFDWGHAAELHVKLGGSCEHFKDRELKVRSAIQHFVKCDFEKENITDPIVLPLADCVITAWLLGGMSKDADDCIKNLKKISGLLKPGGHLIICGSLGTTYYTVGKDKLKAFSYDEDFLRKALVAEEFVIDEWVVNKRTAVSDMIDYKAMIFAVACKQKLV